MRRRGIHKRGISVQAFDELRSIAFATKAADKKVEQKAKPKRKEESREK